MSRKLSKSSKAPAPDSVSTVRHSIRQRLSKGKATPEEHQQFVQMLELSQTEQNKEDQDSKHCCVNAQKYLDSVATVIAKHYDKVKDIRFCEVKDIKLLRDIALTTNENTELIHEKICYYWIQQSSELKEKVKLLLALKRINKYRKSKSVNEDESQSDVSSMLSSSSDSPSNSSTSDRSSSNDESSDEDEAWKALKVSAPRKSRKLSSSSEDCHSSGPLEEYQHENSTEMEKKKNMDIRQCTKDPIADECKTTDSPDIQVAQMTVNDESEHIQQQREQQKTSDPAMSCSPLQAMHKREDQVQSQALQDFAYIFCTDSTNSSDKLLDFPEVTPNSNHSMLNSSIDINASSMLHLPDIQDGTALLQQLKELYYMSTEPQVQHQILNIQAQLEAQQQYQRTVLQLRLEELYRMPTTPQKLQAPKPPNKDAPCNNDNQSACLQDPVSIDMATGLVLQVQSQTTSELLANEQPQHVGSPTDTSELAVETAQLNTQNSYNEDIPAPEVLDISSSDEDCSVIFQYISR